jgi:RED-like protein N-terminal region
MQKRVRCTGGMSHFLCPLQLIARHSCHWPCWHPRCSITLPPGLQHLSCSLLILHQELPARSFSLVDIRCTNTSVAPPCNRRDRADERRKGVNPDYERVNADLASVIGGGGGRAPGEMSLEESKFLGGDVEHTHLVKGLDYALLQKVRGEMVRADSNDAGDVDAKLKFKAKSSEVRCEGVRGGALEAGRRTRAGARGLLAHLSWS